MLSLLADHGFCFLAEQLFLEQLLEDIRLQLSNDDFTHPRVLATKADILWIAKQQAATTINKVTLQPKGQITTTHDTQQKETAGSIAPSFTRLLQLSLSTATVPGCWKQVNVLPLFKTGDRSDFGNYRPISLLNICSKV